MKFTEAALCAAISAVFITTLPTTAIAQDKSRSEGFFLGVAFEGIGVAFEEDDDAADSGAGFGVTVGYGFSPKVSLYGQFSGANVNDDDEDLGVGHFDIATRLHFRAPANTVVPYIQAGLSSRALKSDVGRDDFEATGFGFAVGGGINAHFSPALAFNAGVVWSLGNISDLKVNGASVDFDSTGVTTARVQVGIVWFPQKQ